MNYTFQGNFGTLELVVDDNGKGSGTYQESGTLSGMDFQKNENFEKCDYKYFSNILAGI